MTENTPDIFTVATICHAPCIHYLEGHLQALAQAQNKAGLAQQPVGVVVSEVGTQEQKDRCLKAAENSGLNTRMAFHDKKMSFAAARTAAAGLTSSAWVFFTDVDTVIDQNHFAISSRHLKDVSKDVGAISGGIGVWKASDYGAFDALWEILTLYRRIDKDFEKRICNSLDENWRTKLNDVNQQAFGWLDHRRDINVNFLQAYNMFVRRDFIGSDAFDEKLSGALDRALAAHITGPAKQKIVCWPDCLVYHDFTFTLEQIQQRKIGHAIYTNRVRKTYQEYGNVLGAADTKSWLVDVDTEHPSCPKRSLFPFSTPMGRDYASAAKIAYAYGVLRSNLEDATGTSSPYRDHREVLRKGKASGCDL
jgi:hypothetical protein